MVSCIHPITANIYVQPDITFFGEALPGIFHDRLVKHDRDRVDLVIVIGTSLKVAPVSEVVGFLPPNVPQVYISRTVSVLLCLILDHPTELDSRSLTSTLTSRCSVTATSLSPSCVEEPDGISRTK